jgi:hypothetical protein
VIEVREPLRAFWIRRGGPKRTLPTG